MNEGNRVRAMKEGGGALGACLARRLYRPLAPFLTALFCLPFLTALLNLGSSMDRLTPFQLRFSN
jgi:hypothetical protein